LIISILLFSLVYFFSIAKIIVYTLSFLILLESVRTIYDFVFEEQHRIKLRYLIDGAILFGLRELFVGWVMIKTDTKIGLIIMIVSLFSIFTLLLFRKDVIINSPSKQ